METMLALFPYGGIDGRVLECVLGEMAEADGKILYYRAQDDALISRARSYVASLFYQKTKADVLVMVDHDILWSPGDVAQMAAKAHSLGALVGGFYATRSRRGGHAGRLMADRVSDLRLGTDKLHDAEYLPGGFIAIPRSVLRKIIEAKGVDRCLYNTMEEFWDFFRPLTVPSTLVDDPSVKEYLSEDWAFCHRARLAGAEKQFLWAKPLLGHIGTTVYTMTDAARPG